jgi:hypothetical protein
MVLTGVWGALLCKNKDDVKSIHWLMLVIRDTYI